MVDHVIRRTNEIEEVQWQHANELIAGERGLTDYART
jgi:hypothetical protein